MKTLTSISELGNIVLHVGAITSEVLSTSHVSLDSGVAVREAIARYILVSLQDTMPQGMTVQSPASLIVLDVSDLEGIEFHWSLWAFLLTGFGDGDNSLASRLVGSGTKFIARTDSMDNPMINVLRTLAYMTQSIIGTWTISGEYPVLEHIGAYDGMSQGHRSVIESLVAKVGSSNDADFANGKYLQPISYAQLSDRYSASGASSTLKAISIKYPHLLRSFSVPNTCANPKSGKRQTFNYAFNWG